MIFLRAVNWRQDDQQLRNRFAIRRMERDAKPRAHEQCEGLRLLSRKAGKTATTKNAGKKRTKQKMKTKQQLAVPRENKAATALPAQQRERRQALHAEECARRGVRFLPGQVMRAIFEREGLLWNACG